MNRQLNSFRIDRQQWVIAIARVGLGCGLNLLFEEYDRNDFIVNLAEVEAADRDVLRFLVTFALVGNLCYLLDVEKQ